MTPSVCSKSRTRLVTAKCEEPKTQICGGQDGGTKRKPERHKPLCDARQVISQQHEFQSEGEKSQWTSNIPAEPKRSSSA
jgi:hypothetical protein